MCQLLTVMGLCADCKAVWLGQTAMMKLMTSCGIWSVYTSDRGTQRIY